MAIIQIPLKVLGLTELAEEEGALRDLPLCFLEHDLSPGRYEGTPEVIRSVPPNAALHLRRGHRRGAQLQNPTPRRQVQAVVGLNRYRDRKAAHAVVFCGKAPF